MERELKLGETTLIVSGTLKEASPGTDTTPATDEEFEPEKFMWILGKHPVLDITKPFTDLITAINEHYNINAWEMIDEKLKQ